MSDLGTIRREGDLLLVLLPRRLGYPPIVTAVWTMVCPQDERLRAALERMRHANYTAEPEEEDEETTDG